LTWRKTGRGEKNAQEFCCTKEGKHKAVDEAERVTSKTSKRGRCKAMVLAKLSDDNHMPFSHGFCWTTTISWSLHHVWPNVCRPTRSRSLAWCN
jgi:hypothetical protein